MVVGFFIVMRKFEVRKLNMRLVISVYIVFSKCLVRVVCVLFGKEGYFIIIVFFVEL